MLYGDYLIRTKNPVLLTYLKEEEAKLLRFIVDLSAKAGIPNGRQSGFRVEITVKRKSGGTA